MTIIQNTFWTFIGYNKNKNKAVKQTTFYFPPLIEISRLPFIR